MTHTEPTTTAADAPHSTQTDVVIQGVKSKIVRGTLAPGAKLPIEKDLAAEFRVSRGSLREGIRALATMGILETRQGAGTYVTSLDASLLLAPLGLVAEIQTPANSAHLHSVRRVLESEAALRAASRITDAQLDAAAALLDGVEELVDGDGQAHHERVMEADIEFHRIIARASGNPALEALIEALSNRTVRARVWRTMREDGVMRAAQAEHRAILAELRARDGEAARIRMAGHLLGVERFIGGSEVADPAAAGGSAPEPA
ncbi:FadR/GntR family transcriptional regulator [Demequina maris]|uniref:FadR/GntR family transcriptional regulator n=1 Tax=Demequina maris TaxID=1638982 RepID=UPI0007854E10|nr:FCD domain-containing protein [Demequina maris]